VADNPIQRLRCGEDVPREEILADVDRLLGLYKKRGDQINELMLCIEEGHDFAGEYDGPATCVRCGYEVNDRGYDDDWS
jgi:hypothetical protein